jgi:pimeloyl-ACP methyl ester carboxylesterase
MINQFRAEISRPIIGIGHSMGGAQLVQLALIHPRLFESLILVDPVIQGFTAAQGNISPARSSAFRRDIWPSREAAATAFKKSKFYQTWDPRVLELWIEHGLRELPTQIYPDMPADIPAKDTSKSAPPVTTEPTVAPQPARPVTLKTTKHQEVFTFVRPNFPPDDNPGAPGPHQLTDSNPSHNRITHPDITPRPEPQTPFYRGEAIFIFNQLPHLRPSVFYIFGALSYMSSLELRKAKLESTGTGVGGSGGAPEGRVKDYVMKGTGHLVPMERSSETADRCAEWISAELTRWREKEPLLTKDWEGVPREERYKLREKFLSKISGDLPGLPAVQKFARKEKL